tara:strand:- start:1120 stop:1860 length:741 start_codon:yes stop_codon:yes gene_type:complete
MTNKTKILISIPCYQGTVYMKCMEQCLNLVLLLKNNNIEFEFFSITVESLIPRARNVTAMKFLNSNCSHLLFIDADIIFDPTDVLKMIANDKKVISGTYPKKQLDFQILKNNIKNSNKIEDLISKSVNYALNFLNAPKNNLVEVLDAPTGFMLIKKEVFHIMLNTFSNIKYKNDINSYKSYEYNGFFYDFFQIGIFEERYLSEDFGFCRKLQELNIPIFVDLSINLTHIGTFNYYGCPLEKFGVYQ